MLTAEMVVAFGADLSDLKAGVEQVQAQLNKVEQAAHGPAQAIDEELGGAAKRGGFNLLDLGAKIGQTIFGFKALADGALNIANSFIAPNASMEQTTVAFTSIFHSSNLAQQEIAKLVQFAAATPFQFPALAEADQKLLAFQFTSSETIPLMTAIGDALSALGKSTPAYLSQVVDVFGQMKSNGKLATQDLMQLSSVGINGFQLLADGMHKTVPEIKDMVSKGLIPADEGIKLLQDGMEKTFGGGMQAQSKTFNGLLSTFQDNISSAWRAFTGPLFDAAKAGLDKMGALVSSPAFQNFAKTLGGDVANGLQEAGKWLKPLMDNLGHLGDFAKTALQPFKDEPFGVFLANLKDLGGEVQDALKPLGDVATLALKPLQDSFKISGKDAQDFIASGLYKLGDIFHGMSEGIKPFAAFMKNDVAPALKDALPGFQKLGQTLIKDVAPAIERMAGDRIKTFVHIFQDFAPIIERITPPLIRFAGVIAGDLAAGLKVATPYIEKIWDAVDKFASEIADRVAPIVSKWLDGMKTGIQDFQQIWVFVWPYLSDILSGVWDMIVGIVQVAWSIVSGIVKIGLDLLSGNWSQAWTDCKDMLSGVWEGIKNFLKGALETLSTLITGKKDTIQNALTAPFEAAKNLILGMFDNIQARIGDLGAGFNNTMHNMHVTGYANGTPLGGEPTGGLRMVGEDGPELMYIPQGAHVIPNSRLGGFTAPAPVAMASGGAGGPATIILNISGRELARALGGHMAREIRLQTGVKH